MSGSTEKRVALRIESLGPDTAEFAAEVTAIREIRRVNGRQVWQLALDRTAFRPASGDQRCDTGSLVAISRSGAALVVPITDVVEDEAGEVWHTTHKPLQEATAVRGAVDSRG
ncbi:MAG: hypothetical protein ACRYF4_14485 [Janthinobacterium lividum]